MSFKGLPLFGREGRIRRQAMGNRREVTLVPASRAGQFDKGLSRAEVRAGRDHVLRVVVILGTLTVEGVAQRGVVIRHLEPPRDPLAEHQLDLPAQAVADVIAIEHAPANGDETVVMRRRLLDHRLGDAPSIGVSLALGESLGLGTKIQQVGAAVTRRRRDRLAVVRDRHGRDRLRHPDRHQLAPVGRIHHAQGSRHSRR